MAPSEARDFNIMSTAFNMPIEQEANCQVQTCQSCIDWGSAVAGECYPPGRDVQWKNVNATVLHKDAVEVAKGFVFILPHGQTCASFKHFDIGGILKMMLEFKGYHGGDQTCVDKIQKVVDIRNELSHMNIGAKMHISDAQTNDYFLNIKDLVKDLEGQHICLQSNTIMTDLGKIQSSEVTEDKIKKAIVQALQQQTQDLKQHFGQHHSDIEQLIKDGNLAGAEALQKQTGELQHQLEKLSQDTRLVAEKSDSTDEQIQEAMEFLKVGMEEHKMMLKEIKEEVNRLELKQTQHRKDEALLDVQAIRKQLMTEYKQTRSQVQLLPGIPEECASMDEIFVDMTLCEQQNDSSVRRREFQSDDDPQNGKVKFRKLESHNDLLTIKDKQGQQMKHILVRGDPGCGKLTLISKIAYDWAKNEDPESVYAQFQLVFAIDFKEVLPEMDLFNAIADQLLPKVSKQDLERFIEHNSESVLFLFDGYDETYSSFPGRCRDFKSVLSGTLFSKSFVIMTTRPHKVAAINAKYKINYTHVEVFGLPLLSIFKYVSQFFNVRLEYINWINKFSTSWCKQSRKEFKDVLKIEPPANHRRVAENVASFLLPNC